MKTKIVFFEHAENGLSLYLIPETEAERQLLRGLWKHGTLESNNGVADNSEQGFSVRWKSGSGK